MPDGTADRPSGYQDQLGWVPYQTDIAFRLISRNMRFGPLRVGAFYFFLSYVALQAIGLATGQFFGRNGVPPMHTGLVDHLNMAFLAPVGAALLCHLYRSITHCFTYISQEGLLQDQDTEGYKQLTDKLGLLYNSKWAVAITILVSVAFNAFNYFGKPTEQTWLGVDAGLSGFYGRFFVTLNYHMIMLIVYKSGITVWGLHRLLALYRLKIQPMHPDRCGGLKPLGTLSVAVSNFLGVVMVFISLLVFFDPFARQLIIYPILFVGFYALAPFLMFFSLSKASGQMRSTKAESLRRLANTFDWYYRKLESSGKDGHYDLKTAEEIGKIYQLYGIVEKMPVWPFDMHSVVRFFTTITLPAVFFVIQQILTVDSVLYIAVRKLLGME